jgi:hypothetical protein
MLKNKKIYITSLVILLVTPFTINSALATSPTGGFSIDVTSCTKSGPTLGAIPTDVEAAGVIAGGSNTTALGSYHVDFDCDSSPLTINVSMSTLTNGSDVDIPFSGITYQSAIPAWLGANGTASRPALVMSATPTVGLVLTPILASTKATWIPSLTVVVPADQAVGTYTSTITTSAV